MRLTDLIKLFGSRLLVTTGIVGPARRQHPDRFLVLMYHRILPQTGIERPYFRESMVVTAEAFEQQLQYLMKKANVRPLREVLAKMEKKEPFDPSTVVITFDDGYLDNYLVAFPLLKKYGMTATIFLTTGPVDTGQALAWDTLAAIIFFVWDGKGRDVLKAAPFPKYIGDMEESSKEQYVNALVDALNTFNRAERETFWQELNTWIGAETIPAPERPMMTWEMVKEMADYGISFETHTVTHQLLDELSVQELEQETLSACQRIQEVVRQPADILAYPRGNTLPAEHHVFIQKHFRAAVGVVPGFNTHTTDRYQLYRKDANFLLLNRVFYPAYFEAELCGFWDRLRSFA